MTTHSSELWLDFLIQREIARRVEPTRLDMLSFPDLPNHTNTHPSEGIVHETSPANLIVEGPASLPHGLTRLELYALLVETTGRGATRLSRDIFRGHHDPRRLFTHKQRREVIERDASCCAYCARHVSGDEGDRIYIDHVIPHVLGGQTVVDNGVVACGSCNSSKAARIW